MKIANNGFSYQLNFRLKMIQDLQSKILKKFGDSDYNVFLFGSFLTEDFVPEKSDVDFAIYTENFDKYLEIYCFIDDYFALKNIKRDIFYIDTTIVDPIYCAPLSSVLRFTDFYPEKLNSFYCECLKVKN